MEGLPRGFPLWCQQGVQGDWARRQGISICVSRPDHLQMIVGLLKITDKPALEF